MSRATNTLDAVQYRRNQAHLCVSAQHGRVSNSRSHASATNTYTGQYFFFWENSYGILTMSICYGDKHTLKKGLWSSCLPPLTMGSSYSYCLCKASGSPFTRAASALPVKLYTTFNTSYVNYITNK